MPITENDFYVGGSTSLLDAIGKTVARAMEFNNRVINKIKNKNILIVIVTDGSDNSSKEYTYYKVRELIKICKGSYNWSFILLCANGEAMELAENMGIDKCLASNYTLDDIGMSLVYKSIYSAINDIINNKNLDCSWKEKLEQYSNNI